MEIGVCSLGKPIRLVSARITGKIKALQGLWPGAKKKFIFDGSQLEEHMTFEYYRIKDGDTIVALDYEETDNGEFDFARARWMNITRDTDAFNGYIKSIFDPRTSGESARLRDLLMLRMEGRTKAMQRMCAPFTDAKIKHRTQLVVPESLSVPRTMSSDELPALWREEE